MLSHLLAHLFRFRPWPRAALCVGAAAALTMAAPAQAKPMVLVFHQVGAATGASLGISPDALRRRVETLRRLGYRFVTSSEAARAPAGERVAVIQFDDGFESVYQLAFPVLRELGVPGTAYVIWSRLDQPGSLTRAQVAELRAAGWEVGTHSHSHAALADLSPGGCGGNWAPAPRIRPTTCSAWPIP
ncbi:polysaccharide deacetylase family protein [Deinococcus multiflagellatus]|uniref:Polysaccharide deacetylase family protein n=1 Tax=Deinococcus multiflagellatus TaxID=1656887 RepID=A0ABW1ZQV1_9DEIO